MKRTKQLAAVAVTAVLVAACGGGGSGSKATPSPTPSATPSPLTTTQLKAGLITQAHVPAGYKLDTSASEDDDTTSKAATAECQAKYDLLDKAQETSGTEVEISFTNEEAGVDLSQSWEATGKPATELSQELETFTSLAKDCPQVQLISTDGTPPIDLTLSTFPLPAIGDQSVGLLARGQIQGTLLSLAFAFVRVGSNAQVVFQGGIGQADLALVEKIAKLGVERLPKA